jgi:hypothetical protein
VRRFVLVGVAVLGLALGGYALAQGSKSSGRIGPSNKVQPSGRKLTPDGKRTHIGNHPGGGALTPNGRFYWTLSAGRGRNDVRIVRVVPRTSCHRPRKPRRRAGKAAARRYRVRAKRYRRCRKKAAREVGKVVQRIQMPGLSGGMAMAPDGRTAYVSGLPESKHVDQMSPLATPGKEGDLVHVLRYNRRTGRATRAGTIPLPAPSDAPVPQEFPPRSPASKRQSWPRDLAVSRDGRTLVAALNLADRAAIVDTGTRKVRYVKAGSYPYGAAVTRDGKLGLVSNEADGTVSVIDLKAGTKLRDIQVGPHLSHPEGIAVDPKLPRAYVAVTHQDLIAVIDLKAMKVERTLSVERPQGIGTAPVDVSVTRDGCFLMSADSGEDALAMFALPNRRGRTCVNQPRPKRGKRARPRARASANLRAMLGRIKRRSKAWALAGRVPVASYPVDVDATPKRKKLVWIAAKGVGVGPNPNGPNPNSPNDSDDHINTFGYLPSIVTGQSGIATFPTNSALKKLTPKASRQIRPSNAERPPAGTPIRTGGPIKHVFYVVRENRSYDQVMGDDPRGDGDPKLTLFGDRITPNMHALARRFPLLDHVYANSEASIDGHFWTSAAAVSDYVTKNWHQNYAGRGRPYDFGVYAVTWPSQRFLFDRAEKQGISYFNYGEAVAGVVPVPDKDRTQAETNQVTAKLAKSDLGPPDGCYPNDSSAGGTDSISGQDVYDSSLPLPVLQADPSAESRFDCFRTRFNVQLASGGVPAFNYLSLPNDHTVGTTPGKRTPNALLADNDYALGQLVDLISHSSIWKQSLILVLEDDSQDGADHVDAHRIPALAISPYARRGAVVHKRYDFLSFIRTLELTTGMKPLNLFDALAVPMYDAFSSGADNSDAYAAIKPNVNLNERNAPGSPGSGLSQLLPLGKTDATPQRYLDKVLWKYVHGKDAEPPPPGPNASGEDERGFRLRR